MVSNLGASPIPRGVFARPCRLFELASLKNNGIDYNKVYILDFLNAQPIEDHGSPFRVQLKEAVKRLAAQMDKCAKSQTELKVSFYVLKTKIEGLINPNNIADMLLISEKLAIFAMLRQ